jgi:hypothetical protein
MAAVALRVGSVLRKRRLRLFSRLGGMLVAYFAITLVDARLARRGRTTVS